MIALVKRHKSFVKIKTRLCLNLAFKLKWYKQQSIF